MSAPARAYPRSTVLPFEVRHERAPGVGDAGARRAEVEARAQARRRREARINGARSM